MLSVDEFAAFGVGLAVNSLAVQFADFGLGTIAIAETADSVDPARPEQVAQPRAPQVATALAVAVGIGVAVLLLPPLAPYRATAAIGATGEVFGSLAFFLIWSLQGERRFLSAAGLQGIQGALRLALVGACAIAGLESVQMMVGYAVLAPAITALIAGAFLFMRPPPERDEAAPAVTGSAEIDVERRRVMAIQGCSRRWS